MLTKCVTTLPYWGMLIMDCNVCLSDKLHHLLVHLYLHRPHAFFATAGVERVVRGHVHVRLRSREVTRGKHAVRTVWVRNKDPTPGVQWRFLRNGLELLQNFANLFNVTIYVYMPNKMWLFSTIAKYRVISVTLWQFLHTQKCVPWNPTIKSK